MKLPQIGESVLVLHTSNGNGKLNKLKRSLGRVSQVSTVYLEGDVGVEGDVFSVKPCADGKAKWETVS